MNFRLKVQIYAMNIMGYYDYHRHFNIPPNKLIAISENGPCTPTPAPMKAVPDSEVYGTNMGPTWVLSAPDGPRDGPVNFAPRGANFY